MLVQCVIDDTLGYRLKRQAGAVGMSVDQYVARLIQADDRSRPPAYRIGHLVTLGWCDADIAREIGYTNDRVGVIRRSLGLKPNRRYAKPT